MKKTMVLALIAVAFFALVLSCASSSSGGGASAAAAGEIFYGKWRWEPLDDSGDGGSSTITMEVTEEVIDGKTETVHTFFGEVTADYEWGSCLWEIIPEDDETLEKLRTATAISFKALADGNQYFAQLPSPAVTDWAYHQRTLNTKAGEVEEWYLIMRTFTQPAWGDMKRLDLNSVEMFKMITMNADRGANVGPYRIKIWDLKLHH